MNGPDHGPGPDSCSGDAAAYVLGALDQHEAESFRVHLASCAVCRDEVVALQAVADLLPAAAPPVAAPPELKQRVMATVYAEAGLLAAASDARRPAARASRRFRRPASLSGFRAPVGAGLAAAVVIAALLISSGGSSSGTHLVPAHVAGAAATASAELRRSGDRAELLVAHMQQAPAGRIYEVWVQRAGRAPQATSALFAVNAAGAATVDVPGGVRGVRTVMVTAEPDGGSSTPTGMPLIVANLT